MLITTICDSEDDKMLIEAMKSMPWSTVEIELEYEVGTKVTVTNKDFNRFIDLAEYGLKMKNTIKEETKEETSVDCNENKREEDAEHSEKQPEPHFKYNYDECTFDCSKCLCNTCLNYKCDLAESCVETCCNITCHNDYYVDSCPAYNDKHNF